MITATAPPPTPDSRILTVPNVLSLARLASVPVFLWLFISGFEEAAVILYAVGALSDFFDGVIARRFAQVTEVGKVLDPLADRVFIVALAVALTARGALPVWLAAAVVARDVAVLSLWPVLERRGLERIPVNFTGKVATALLLTGLTWLALSETSFPFARAADEVGLAVTIAGAVVYWVAGGLYARTAVQRLRGLGPRMGGQA